MRTRRKSNRSPKRIPNEIQEQFPRAKGYRIIAGLDEVGRGAWAGPLVMAAVILPPDRRILGLRDSKVLTRAERERLARRIKRVALSWAIGSVEIHELNREGLAAGLRLAASRAITNLSPQPDFVLFDGLHANGGLALPQQSVVHGDASVRIIAAASVIAKVARDQMMRSLHRTDPAVRRFRFDLNKGYPSPVHKQELTTHGPSPHHRLGFAPVRLAANQQLFPHEM